MTISYYDELAPHYRLLYPNWEASLSQQAEALDQVIRREFGPKAELLLDASCGIGTQAIGLAERGYAVTASDLSPQAIQHARIEAQKRGLDISFSVADMRQVWDALQTQFHIVIACDNSVPHLLTDNDIVQALSQFYRCTLPGGGCILSVRDYANMKLGGTRIYPRRAEEVEGVRLVLFDVWAFEGDQYDLTTYIVHDDGENPPTIEAIRGGRYYCVSIKTLEALLTKAGFSEVRVLMDAFFQPLLVGLKPATTDG